jgi:hypothetical protein
MGFKVPQHWGILGAKISIHDRAKYSFLLAHWVYLSTDSSKPPDWGQASASALQTLFPDVALCSLFSQVERLRPLLQSFGLQLQLVAVTT